MADNGRAAVQSLIDAQENPFVLIDRDYRIVAANAAYCEAYGVEEGREVVGRFCYEVSHHQDHPCHLDGED
ncbi:MAG TPA: PAS domain-containing protein, partial [Gammaproteobacteria bacterium]|nr:PAS domain-containing protein [Gammaproteobacteria bacterium]